MRSIIVRRPLDEAAQRRGQRRRIQHVQQGPQPVVAYRRQIGEAAFVPHHADHRARPERRHDDLPRLDSHAMRHAVVERTEGGIEKDDPGAAHAKALAPRAPKRNRPAMVSTPGRG
mgnify:CR=1 FL=1